MTDREFLARLAEDLERAVVIDWAAVRAIARKIRARLAQPDLPVRVAVETPAWQEAQR